MPSVEEHTTPNRPKPRVNRTLLEPMQAALLESQDDLRDGVLLEVKGGREDVKHLGTQIVSLIKWGLGLFAVGGLVWIVTVASLLYYTLSLFGEYRGVDTSRAASSSATVISANADAITTTTATLSGTDAGTTTVTTTTPAPPPAATDAPEAPATGPTDTEH